jgi:hypothetical protein
VSEDRLKKSRAIRELFAIFEKSSFERELAEGTMDDFQDKYSEETDVSQHPQ